MCGVWEFTLVFELFLLGEFSRCALGVVLRGGYGNSHLALEMNLC